MSTGRGKEWPIAARDAELDGIDMSLAEGSGVLLIGDAGVGKSRLLRAALEHAAQGDAAVVSVNGHGGVGIDSYGSLAECLDRYFGGADVRYDPSAAERVVGAERPLVLGLDDAHLADSVSVNRLQGLIRHRRVILVAAISSCASAPSGINQLWVERLIERREVKEFDRSGVAKLLAVTLGEHVAAETLENMWELTRGNALLLRELVESALTKGTLRRVGGMWQWTGIVDKLCERLADLVCVRLGDLDQDEYELVRIIALAEPLEANLPIVAEFAAAAESLDRRGIVTVERDGMQWRLRLRYPLYTPVIVSNLPELTGRRLRSSLADAIEQAGMCRDDEVIRVVALRIDAGQIPDPVHLRMAAALALRRLDFRQAERLCRFALENFNTHRSEMVLLLGRALAGQRRHVEAETEFARVSATDLSLPEAGEAVRMRGMNLAWGLRRVREAATVIDDAIVAGSDFGPLLGAQATVRLLENRLDELATSVDSVLDGPLDLPSVQAVVPPAAFARLQRGDTEGAQELLGHCRHVVDQWDDDARLAHGLVTVSAMFHGGDVAGATALLDEMYVTCEDERRRRLGNIFRARLYRHIGRSSEAVLLLRQASAFRSADDWFTTQAWILAELAGALAESGEHTEAMRTLVEVSALQATLVQYPIALDGIAMERAIVLAHVGDHTVAVRQALEVAERAAPAGRRVQAMLALHLAARLGNASDSVEQVAALNFRQDSGLSALYADHVHALARCDGDTLDVLAARFGSLGLQPLAAEASAQAVRAHQRYGRHRKSRVARARCGDVLSKYGVSVPGWAALDTERSSGGQHFLTTREWEVVSLAVSRMSNQEIADRLVVSVRTIENHLHRVYGKLGVTARAELSRYFDHRSIDRRPVNPVARSAHGTAAGR